MIEKFIVHREAALHEALKVIDGNAHGVAFVVDTDGRMCGLLTDGDVRRALLAGSTLSTPTSAVMNTRFRHLPVGSDLTAIRAHLVGKVRILPLLDADGRPSDYASLYQEHKIPVLEPLLDGNEAAYVRECLETNWISSQGRFVTQFESDFAAFTGAPHALTVSSGTTGLHLALMALGVGPGDEVIVPDLTFAASAAAVIHAGATPVLVDVDLDSWAIDVEQARAAITPRTRAIMPVHLYGQPADMDAILALAREHNLLVIEDAAEALGATYNGRHAGTLGDAGVFSFFGNKLITTGEGGMVTFTNGEAAARARQLRDHGMDRTRRYWHVEVGYNYRMTNLQAAIGVAQLEQIGQRIDRKLEIAAIYNQQLRDLPGVRLPAELDGRKNIFWAYTALFDGADLGMSRDTLLQRLADSGVECRPIFFPLHTMPPYRQYAGNRAFPNSLALSRDGLTLPTGVRLSDDQINYVVQVIRRLYSVRELMSMGE
ncbi:MAG: aminotransferase class I/II-fold pyridoxal phosphate-dependent enzyme [Alphaproteobacteria bacterium]|nr:aminotransferase class I/II-fold pyridoxal phosphate-dependent enzyme [Alphaproteobacteria bacterium]